MTTLTITPTGTVNSAVSEHPNLVEARRALVEFAKGYRINGSGMSGTLTVALRPGGVHQASYTYTIEEA
jgi:hypothetical protein